MNPLRFGGMGDDEHRISAWWVVPLSALAWWAGGFLPWIAQVSYEVTGLADGVPAGAAGFLPLPVTGDDALTSVVVMALVGGVVAGALARLPASRGAGAGAAVGGVLLAMAGAGGATWWLAARGGLPHEGAPVWMLVVTGVAGLVGLGLGLLAGLGPAPLRGVALALPVVLLDGWLWGFVPGHPVTPHSTWWIFAVGLGLALGLAVDSRPIELLGWLPTAGAVWVLQATGAALVAVQANLWPGSPLTEQPLGVFRVVWHEIAPAAIRSEGHQLGAWVVALLLGAAVAALRLSREAADEESELSEAWA